MLSSNPITAVTSLVTSVAAVTAAILVIYVSSILEFGDLWLMYSSLLFSLFTVLPFTLLQNTQARS